MPFAHFGISPFAYTNMLAVESADKQCGKPARIRARMFGVAHLHDETATAESTSRCGDFCACMSTGKRARRYQQIAAQKSIAVANKCSATVKVSCRKRTDDTHTHTHKQRKHGAKIIFQILFSRRWSSKLNNFKFFVVIVVVVAVASFSIYQF